jgi:fluoride exporter
MNQWMLALGVAAGAVVGALMRWSVGLWLNPLWAGFPLGTLVVNMAGGAMAGAAYVVLGKYPSDPWRALAVTGFLGGLTTFSSFSAESLALIERDRWQMAVVHTLVHVLGALACAIAGARLARLAMA